MLTPVFKLQGHWTKCGGGRTGQKESAPQMLMRGGRGDNATETNSPNVPKALPKLPKALPLPKLGKGTAHPELSLPLPRGLLLPTLCPLGFLGLHCPELSLLPRALPLPTLCLCLLQVVLPGAALLPKLSLLLLIALPAGRLQGKLWHARAQWRRQQH